MPPEQAPQLPQLPEQQFRDSDLDPDGLILQFPAGLFENTQLRVFVVAELDGVLGQAAQDPHAPQ